MHTTQRWLRSNTKHRNNKGYSIPRHWLYTADILPCYNGIELYTPLYVTFICAYPVKDTIGIYESTLESPRGSRKYPGYNRQVCTWVCMCASVCGYEEVPIFVESALWLLTDCCLFGHQVICNYTVLPAVTAAIISGETNDFVKQSWCQYLININIYALIRHRRLGCSGLLKKNAVGC